MSYVLLAGLTIIACASPLLTVAKLFQMKEWRLDRLREHLRHEGWFTQLFGFVRPVTVAVLLAAIFFLTLPQLLLPGLALLAGLTLVQFVLRRQPRPVWTQKAITLTATALAIATVAVLSLAFTRPLTLPITVILQPLVLLAAWALWKPVDSILKYRIMARAARLRRAHPSLTVIGITGSVGKTTTKELLRHILEPLGAIATPEYVNSEMGVAGWLIQTLTACRSSLTARPILIVEMGAYRKGEIKRLCQIAQPQIGVLTAIGTQHLGLFGSEQAIIDAKSELLESLPSSGHAFVNAESSKARIAADRSAAPVTFVGRHPNAVLRPENVAEERDGLHFSLGATTFSTPLQGLHNLSNVLLAMAVARHLKVPDNIIRERLASFHSPSHTFSVRTERGITLLDDTHNSSPQSLRAGLEWSAARSERPRVLLTNGLLELGREEGKILRELGAFAAGKVERVIFTTKRGSEAFAEGFGKSIEYLEDHSAKVPAGGLLLCLGRMPMASIQKILPPS